MNDIGSVVAVTGLPEYISCQPKPPAADKLFDGVGFSALTSQHQQFVIDVFSCSFHCLESKVALNKPQVQYFFKKIIVILEEEFGYEILRLLRKQKLGAGSSNN